MDSTPPYRSEPRSSTKPDQSPNLSLGLVPSSPKKTLSPSPLCLRSSGSLPLQELLLLSPSPLRKSKSRLADRLEMAAEESMEPAGTRRRCKSRTTQMGLLGCASPRNIRRSRRRSEQEIREEGLVEEIAKPRKRRQSGRTKKEKLSMVPSVPCSSSSPKTDEEDQVCLNRIGQLMNDLIMWKDVTKSSLWFGVGSLFFLSSCFTNGVSFSIFSALSQLGFLFLGASFFSNSICQRNNTETKPKLIIKEDDILLVAKVILPTINLAISKTRELFSGEPSMTLKVAPILILGAEYGHLITPWRLCSLGFFIAFTVPKLYSYYSIQISQKVEYLTWWLVEAWGSCSHKKIVAASAAAAFWNLSSVKTRIFTAFIFLVLLRCCRQRVVQNVEDEEAEGDQQEQQQALVVADIGGCQK
ncbi:reticulon-like protein B17 [Ziziphus jujuba]|uniref:Reticulon-like protein n=1 Tax=Ziziphus jujuba TaxID=326968 RepID=A0A6P3ZPU5_ZIZJJ|nr:reticulon-like protein B17 [Ziziphus jujuba]